MRFGVLTQGLCSLLTMMLAVEASAHARWLESGPTPGRTTNDNIKSGPCGYARTNSPAVFRTGETVTLEWEATIYHRGYFRVAFSPANDQGFDDHVLLDNMAEVQGQRIYSAEVTLPDTPCTDCTLQLIQVMLDRNPPTNYYSCADIQLVADMQTDTTPPDGATELTITGALPTPTLSWQNPTDDFAGVIVTRGTDQLPHPQMGLRYEVGDKIDGSRVEFAGIASQAMLSEISDGTWLTVFTHDAAYNYSASAAIEATAPNNRPHTVSLRWEQNGFSDAIYLADGEVIVQADISDPDGVNSHLVAWSASEYLANNNTDSGVYQYRFDPSTIAPNTTLTVTGEAQDGVRADFDVAESIFIPVKAYSRYLPSIVIKQGGKVVSAASTTGGEVTLELSFNGDAPADLDAWQVQWQQELTGANAGDHTLSFTPNGAGTWQVAATVSHQGVQAAETITLNVTVNKPMQLGRFGSGLIGLALLLIGVRRLQGRR